MTIDYVSRYENEQVINNCPMGIPIKRKSYQPLPTHIKVIFIDTDDRAMFASAETSDDREIRDWWNFPAHDCYLAFSPDELVIHTRSSSASQLAFFIDQPDPNLWMDYSIPVSEIKRVSVTLRPEYSGPYDDRYIDVNFSVLEIYRSDPFDVMDEVRYRFACEDPYWMKALIKIFKETVHIEPDVDENTEP